MKRIFESNDFNEKSDNNVIVSCIVDMKINNFNDNNGIVETPFHLLIFYLTYLRGIQGTIYNNILYI